MGPETVNKLKGSEIHGDFVGHDKITNIIMFQDSEREFVVTHNANIKPVAYFTGRETELRDLRQRIEEGRKSVLVSGMGGIGKTHICRKLFEEYLNRYAEDGDGLFRHIGYIEYSGDMGSSLQNCLKFKKQEYPEQSREAAWRELEYLAADGKLLLFVDNVNRSVTSDLGLQRLKSIPGAVVLTSRQTSFSDEFEPYRIGFLDMGRCKEIYEKVRFGGSGRRVKPEEVPDLEYVIDSLAGRHTITVEHLAHLAYTKTWTVKRLREELEQKSFRLAFHKDGELINIQESYEVLYDLSKLTEAEQNILEAFSVFPYIPLNAEVCNQWLLADAGAGEDDDIFMGLYEKGWLQFDMEQEGYTLHPVFARFIFEKCKPTYETHYGLIVKCQEALEIPESDFTLREWKHISFVESIIEKVHMEKSKLQADSLYGLGRLWSFVAEYEKAEKIFEKCVKIYQDVLGEEHLNTVKGYESLADAYFNNGKYKKAEEMYKRCLQIRKKILGEEHEDTAETYNDLAYTYYKQGRYREAGEMYKKDIQAREKMPGHLNYLMALSQRSQLALVYFKQKRYKEAEELYIKNLQFRKKIPEWEMFREVQDYLGLSMVYEKQGKFEMALACLFTYYKNVTYSKAKPLPGTSIYGWMKKIFIKWKPDGDFEQWLDEKINGCV